MGIPLVAANRVPRIGPGSLVESFDCTHHDGSFCVVRVTGDADRLESDDLLLYAQGHRFAPVEVDGDSSPDGQAQFLLPSLLLAGDDTFVLEAGADRLALPSPDVPPALEVEDPWIELALIAQSEQLADGRRRLTELRQELRDQRERAYGAEEALDEARSRFDVALLAHREEAQKSRREAAETGAAREATEHRVAELEAELTSAREALEDVHAAVAEAERRASEAEEAARGAGLELERQADAAKEAADEASEARLTLASERAGHRHAEQLAAAVSTELEGSRVAAAQAAAEARSAWMAVEQERLTSAELRAELEALRAAEPEPEPEPVALVEIEPEPVAVVEVEPEPEPAALVIEEQPEAPEPQPEAEQPTVETAVIELPPDQPTLPAAPGARLIALDMALNGTPREETADYLAAHFELDDIESLLDQIYVRAEA
jgi:hypothetical protein